MKTLTHEIKDPMGLHARPAGQLCKAAAGHSSTITIETPKGKADAKRIMAVMRLAAKQGDTITLTIEGEDEETAAAALQAFLEENV